MLNLGERWPVIYCCITNHPNTYWLKTTNIYFFTHSVVYKSGHNLIGFPGSESLSLLHLVCQLEQSLISRLKQRMVHLQAHHIVVGWIKFPTAVSRRPQLPATGSLQSAIHHLAANCSQSKQWREWESAPETDATVFM